MLIITRADFKKLAEIRLKDAKSLLEKRRYDGAYYLCGYVVECGLKACVARRLRQYQYPDLSFVKAIYTHNLRDLVKHAELTVELENTLKTDKQFAVYWSVLLLWSEQSRYNRYGRGDAWAIYDAVADENHGVLQWIKRYW
jgi:HEPN domain